MALFERLIESRALSFQTIFRTGLDTFPARPESGFFVDSDTAMRNPAVWAAQRLLVGDISTLPVEAFMKDPTGSRHPLRPKPAWIEEPDPFDPSFTRISHFGEVALSILQDGNSFTLVEPSVLNPVRLEVLRPNLVRPHKAPGENAPTYAISDSRGRVVDELTSLNIIHIAPFRKPGQLRGLNPIDAASEGIGISLAAERYTARWFLSGASMPGFVTVPGEATQPQIDEMDHNLRKSKGGWRNAGVMGYLTGGASYVPSGVKPVDSDLSAIRTFQIEEVCRIYGIPPHMMGITTEKGSSVATVEQRSIDYVAHGLRHYIEPIEIAYRRLVPGDASTYLKFNLAGLLRGDILTRYQAYNIGIRDGFLSIDDVRGLEDMSPVKGGEVYRVQAQMTDITAEPAVAPGVGGNVTGGPMEPPSPAATQSATRELTVDVRSSIPEFAALTEVIGELRRDVGQLHENLGRPVEPPIVNVEAPIVNLPETVVNVPAVTIPALDLAPLAAVLDKQARSMDRLELALTRPRTVLRDGDGAVVGVE